MKTNRRSEIAIAAEAAEWHVRQGQLDRRERQAFVEWLKASPRHLRELLFMETLADGLRRVDPQRRYNVGEMLADPSGDVVSLQRPEETFLADDILARGRRRRAAAIAAGVAILAAAGWLLPQFTGGWQSFATAVGEQRAIQLPDNSVVNLNTGSRLKVRFSEHARDIRLLKGEAFFKVQQDAVRPFRVHTHDAVIQAVGTQFNVYRRTADTMVSVLEGRVQVTLERQDAPVTDIVPVDQRASSPAALSAGEEARIGADGQITRHTTPDVADVAAWRQRRLVFHEDSLVDMATEFNRYNRTPKIRLEGIDGSTQHYTGTFDADDPQALAQLLSRQKDLTVETTAAQIVIRPR